MPAPRRATTMAEHLVNDEGQVMVLLPPLRRPPHSWQAFDGGVVGLVVPGEPPRFFSLTEGALALALESRWLLVVEVAEQPERETWVERGA